MTPSLTLEWIAAALTLIALGGMFWRQRRPAAQLIRQRKMSLACQVGAFLLFTTGAAIAGFQITDGICLTAVIAGGAGYTYLLRETRRDAEADPEVTR